MYAALPVIEATSSDQLCSASESLCLGSRFSSGTWDPAGSALVFAVIGNGPQLLRIATTPGQFQPIGRSGSGPGEYRFAGRLSVDSSGDISMLDLIGRRFVRFSADGAPLATATLELPARLIDAFPMRRHVVYLASASGRAGDTAAVATSEWDPDRDAISGNRVLALSRPVTQLGQMVAVPPRFAPRATFGIQSSGKVIFAEGTRLEIQAFDRTGAHEALVGFDRTPRAVTTADRERAAQELGVPVGNPQMQSAIRASTRASLEGGPANHPAVTALIVGSDDVVWLREAPRESGDSVSWIVFDRDLAPRSRVLLATTDRVLAVLLDRIIVTNDDSDGSFTDLRVLRFSK